MLPDTYLDICITTQQLFLIENGQTLKTYPISTAKNGAGEVMGSGCTPRGWHSIRAKIGAGCPYIACLKPDAPQVKFIPPTSPHNSHNGTGF